MVGQCSVNQADSAMGMDLILNKEGENKGGIVNIKRKISEQRKGKDGILSRVTCLECERLYRDLLVKNLVV
jgi:hypothetical protein